MRMIEKAMGLAAALLLTLGGAAGPVSAQELSELTVKKYMDWAWQQLPDKFTGADGKVIIFDKKNKDSILVPVEAARDVIMAGWRSVRAQACNLPDEQRANFESLKARENAKKKWSEQQTKYMLILHLTVMQLMTGKIKITVKDGKNVVSEEELPSRAVKPCTDEERAKLKETTLAYVKSGPTMASPPPAPAAAKPDAKAQPAAAKAEAKK